MFNGIRIAAVTGLLAGGLVGCGKKAEGPGAAPVGAFAVQVVAVPATARPLSESISLVGSIAPNEVVDVKAEVDGLVTTINFTEGGRVEKDQLLVALDQTRFVAQLAEAEANLKLASTSFERTKQLFSDKLISQQEYDQASATHAANEAGVDMRRRELKNARILAPFGGIAAARLVSPGQVISRSSPLTTVVDLDTVKVEVNVPERYLGELKIGQKIDFKVAAFPKDSFTGEVFFISPQLEPTTRTALVKARITNRDGKLRGGMFANLDLSLQLRESALLIPEPAIINNGDVTMVFAVTAEGTAVMKPVKIGLRIAGRAEVLSGLVAGEKVVVEGTQKLRPGAPVRLSTNDAAYSFEQVGK